MFEIKDDEKKVERAIIIGLRQDGLSEQDLDIHLDELEQLLENIHIPVVHRIKSPLKQPQPRYLVGTGKAQEVAELCAEYEADCLIFDDNISPSQQRNWEKLLNIAVIERHEIILDIFSDRALTKEAKLQIKLAKAKYNLPRLTRAWTHLSRQRGGGNGRGDGEQQIELDKRMTRDRIKKLEDQLEVVRGQRQNQRKQRLKKTVPNAAIVGYTNAGKSSILNHMTYADVLAADKLFATLDPTTKPIILENKQKILLTDTVGFIRKLPHQLVESFKATLEEAELADFLVHVIDINSPHLDEYYETTLEVLADINAGNKTMITVFNKIDIVESPEKIEDVRKRYPGCYFISSKTGAGIEELKLQMENLLNDILTVVNLEIPHSRFDLVAKLHENCEIISEKYDEDNIKITVNLLPILRKDVETFIVE